MPLSSPLFVIYGDYGYSPRDRGAGRSEAARKMIFFRNRGGISKGGDRNWPTASYRDSHRSRSLLSSPLSATDPRFELETFVFFSTIDRIYVSRFEVNFILLFNRMKYVLSSRTDVEERRLSRFQILSTRVIKLHTGSTMGRERSIRKREKKNFLLERNVFFLRRSSSPFLLARFINNDDPVR